ncbi:GDSL-type esterase/lipase family protein [Paenibacillus sp. N1-5-1-14]|uniref:GDSL-type esterase/lipase family protein n=1 Tax=Paenibacillus radicibacter TaxID=2972488 RepID=UPI002159268D|nr:GDSL-type esterase/lipase family protein [Paenibacillus radicibacter]MCR8643586.1 GDSL-type esterase/lipase family protein [Paenibacillus radicibacter]
MKRISIVQPGAFGVAAAADSRRLEFDIGNEVLLTKHVPVDFVFIGDSITQLWDLHTYFGASSKVHINRGISGDVSGHVLRRFQADVIQLNPKYVVLKIGINNMHALDAWSESGRKLPDAIHHEVEHDVREMLVLASKHQIKPILCSILPVNMDYFASLSVKNELIRNLNISLRKLAEQEGAIFVDYHSHLTTEDGTKLRDGLADDGLHPHIVGYDIMATVLRDTLQQHGIEI